MLNSVLSRAFYFFFLHALKLVAHKPVHVIICASLFRLFCLMLGLTLPTLAVCDQ